MLSVSRRWWRYAPPALLCAVGVLVVLWLSSTGTSQPSAQARTSRIELAVETPGTVSEWKALGVDHRFVNGTESLPASLAGTEVPDGLRIDASGKLIVTTGLLDIFEYFLSALGEEDLDTLVSRIRAYLGDNLPGSALAEANRILEGYLAWRDNLATIEQAGGGSAQRLDLDAVRAQQADVKASCTRFLDAITCDVFFAEQYVRDDYEINRLTVLQDDSLDAVQKAERLAALTAALPAPMQAQISAITQYQALQTLTQSLNEEGGSAADLRRVREQVVGAAAADRLERLDQRRAGFNQRLESWYRERARLQSESGLSEADRQAEIDRQRAQRFKPDELVRVQTLEGLADRR